MLNAYNKAYNGWQIFKWSETLASQNAASVPLIFKYMYNQTGKGDYLLKADQKTSRQIKKTLLLFKMKF